MLKQRRGPRPVRRRQPAQRADMEPRIPIERAIAALVGLPRVDRALEGLLRRPRLLLCAALLLLLGMVLWTILPWLSESGPVIAPTMSLATPPAEQVQRTQDDRAAAVNLLSAYNAASIQAGAQGDAAVLAPYLDPNGPAWRDIQAEYVRRMAGHETHAAVLVRWDILGSTIQGDRATLVTSETWQDTVRMGTQPGVPGVEQTSTLVYLLERVEQRWRIVAIEAA